MRSDEPELLNLLVAYPYMTADMIRQISDRQSEIRFLLDSGAFTAWKAGKSINVDDYCRFIESLPIKPWRYFTLDIIGDPAGSLKNYDIMLKRGFKPIPIFTRGEDISVIDDYYKTSDIVGIGGLVGTRGNRGFVNGIMQKIKSRKVHWLGFTPMDYIKKYKPYSCDSSSWASPLQYGRARLYDSAGRMVVICKDDFKTKPNIKIQSLCIKHGIMPNMLRNKAEWKNGSNGLTCLEKITYRSGIKLQEEVYKYTSTIYFLAVVQATQVRCFIEAIKYWKKKETAR